MDRRVHPSEGYVMLSEGYVILSEAKDLRRRHTNRSVTQILRFAQDDMKGACISAIQADESAVCPINRHLRMDGERYSTPTLNFDIMCARNHRTKFHFQADPGAFYERQTRLAEGE